MKRALLAPLLLLMALPAVADEQLDQKLAELEARIANLRESAKREEAERAESEKRLAALDAEIAEAKKVDQTALGLSTIEDVLAERARMAEALRSAQREIAGASQDLTEDVATLEKQRTPVDLDGLLEKSRNGDATARTELLKIRARIDQTVPPTLQQAASSSFQLGGAFGARVMLVQQVAVAGGGRLQVMPSSGPAQPEAPEQEQPRPEAPLAEKNAAAAQDLTDQQERAMQLENRIVEMTRKVLELEARLSDLRRKVAQADRG